MLCSVKLFMKHILKHRVLYINKVLIFLFFLFFFFFGGGGGLIMLLGSMI